MRWATAGSPTAPRTQRADGDAELVDADHQGDVLHRPQGGAGEAGAGLGPRLDLGSAARRPGRTRRRRRTRCRAAARRASRRAVTLFTSGPRSVGRSQPRPRAAAATAGRSAGRPSASTVRTASCRRASAVPSGSRRSGTRTSATSPTSGTRPSTLQHQAGDGVVVLVVGQLDAGQVLHLVGTQQAGERPAAVAQLAGVLAAPVVLVGDVADDLLDDVLERDDAGVPAVLVEHDGHLEAVLAQQREQRVEAQRVGHHDRLDHQVLDPGGRPLGQGQRDGVLDVHGADDVLVLVEHREAGVAGLRGPARSRRSPGR